MEELLRICSGQAMEATFGEFRCREEERGGPLVANSVPFLLQRSAAGLTSIIIPCKDAVRFTRECLESVLAFTDTPYELIVVDNGSKDATPELLAEAARSSRPRHCREVKIIENKENLGFARAVNQALRISNGEFLLLLNNDVVVSTSWLSDLLGPARSDSRVGLLGPMTNYAAAPQLVESIPYKTAEEFHRFAAQWREKELGRMEASGRLTGLCLLLRREVLQRVGMLDENFELGFFEDDDLCLRATDAGYLCVVVRQVYVHHYGNQTFKLLGIDSRAQLESNYRRFREKWGERADRWKPPRN